MTPGLIPYVGGKSNVAGRIAALLPPHHCYVEPFAGGLAVLRAKAPAAVEIVNDLDGELIHLFKTVAFRVDEFLAAIESLPLSRRLFADWLKADPTYMSPIWRAARTYYLLSYSWGAKGEHFGPHCTQPFRRLSRSALEAFRARTARVIWESMDAAALIERYDSAETCFYLDPPYLGRDWYAQSFGGAARHTRLRDQLGRCRGRWLLSHTDHPAIRELYARFHIAKLAIPYAYDHSRRKKRPTQELLISNYEPKERGKKEGQPANESPLNGPSN